MAEIVPFLSFNRLVIQLYYIPYILLSTIRLNVLRETAVHAVFLRYPLPLPRFEKSYRDWS